MNIFEIIMKNPRTHKNYYIGNVLNWNVHDNGYVTSSKQSFKLNLYIFHFYFYSVNKKLSFNI